MKRWRAQSLLQAGFFIVGIALLLAVESVAADNPASRPNIIVFLADDLGFSDLGCYGSEISTPNLDSLAANGLRFTQFYNTARCWPTRAALLTGYYAQQVRRDSVAGVKSGGKGVRPGWAKLLPQLLEPYGYRSYHSGKWHVDGMPLANGFDRSYYLEDVGRYFNPRVHFLDDQKLPPIERDTGYYATIEIANRTIEFLQDHQAKHATKPFFAYVCFNAPHFPLQALPEDIAKYRDRYRVGWDVIRKERSQRLKKQSIAAAELSPLDRETGPPYPFPNDLKLLGPGETNRPVPWSELSDQQRDFQSAKMAIHAAMIDRMDHEIGRILDQLRAMKAFENTLIFFLSDNGASAEIMVRDDGHDPGVSPGSAGTHLCLGPGWSSAANTPLRLHKTWVHEGGIATPLIAHWPKGINEHGKLRHTPGHVIDFVATILELAAGRASSMLPTNAPPMPGRSLVPLFERDGGITRDELWWSHEGNRAIRIVDWKLVSRRDAPWELYDLKTDRGEQHNLATRRLEKARDLEARWKSLDAQFTAGAIADSP